MTKDYLPHQFKPGESGNPRGRPITAPEVRKQIQTNAEKGVARLAQLLEDDDAFGCEGWLSGKEQIALAALAMDRGYGRAENVSVSHTHSGTVGLNVSNRLKEVAQRLPERLAQSKIIDAKAEDAELLDTNIINDPASIVDEH